MSWINDKNKGIQKTSSFFKKDIQYEVMRRGCMNELNMCCQTLCTRQAVFNYISYLENLLNDTRRISHERSK